MRSCPMSGSYRPLCLMPILDGTGINSPVMTCCPVITTPATFSQLPLAEPPISRDFCPLESTTTAPEMLSETVCKPSSEASEAAKHEADHGQVDPGRAGGAQ